MMLDVVPSSNVSEKSAWVVSRVQLIPLVDEAMRFAPLFATIKKIASEDDHVIPVQLLASGTVRAVHVIPSVEVEIIPSPTATKRFSVLDHSTAFHVPA